MLLLRRGRYSSHPAGATGGDTGWKGAALLHAQPLHLHLLLHGDPHHRRLRLLVGHPRTIGTANHVRPGRQDGGTYLLLLHKQLLLLLLLLLHQLLLRLLRTVRVRSSLHVLRLCCRRRPSHKLLLILTLVWLLKQHLLLLLLLLPLIRLFHLSLFCQLLLRNQRLLLQQALQMTTRRSRIILSNRILRQTRALLRHLHLSELLLWQRGAHQMATGSNHPRLVNCRRLLLLNHRPRLSWLHMWTLQRAFLLLPMLFLLIFMSVHLAYFLLLNK